MSCISTVLLLSPSSRPTGCHETVSNNTQTMSLSPSPNLNVPGMLQLPDRSSSSLDESAPLLPPAGVRLPQHVRLGRKRLVRVQGDPLALPEVLLPARSRTAAGPGGHLKQRPNIVPDAELHRKKVQAEGGHFDERSRVQAAVAHRRPGQQDDWRGAHEAAVLFFVIPRTFTGDLNQAERIYFPNSPLPTCSTTPPEACGGGSLLHWLFLSWSARHLVAFIVYCNNT